MPVIVIELFVFCFLWLL